MMLWNDVLTMLGWMLYRLSLWHAIAILRCNIGWVAVEFYSRMGSSGGARWQDTGFCPLRIMGYALEQYTSQEMPNLRRFLARFWLSDNQMTIILEISMCSYRIWICSISFCIEKFYLSQIINKIIVFIIISIKNIFNNWC